MIWRVYIGRHAIRDQDFHAIGRKILGKDRAQAARNEISFVADGHNDGDEGERYHSCCITRARSSGGIWQTTARNLPFGPRSQERSSLLIILSAQRI